MRWLRPWLGIQLFLHRRVSEKQITQFLTQERRRPLKEIKPRGKVDWDSALPAGDVQALGLAAWAHMFGDQFLPHPLMLLSMGVRIRIAIMFRRVTLGLSRDVT